MNRLERITSILLMLQSRRKVTAQQLADHFETSIRTIYRDVRVLEEAGVPVGAEAGLGYYLMDGYSLPPVMLSKEEAAAMLMGEKLLDKFGDVSMNKEIKNAMQKIRAVLRNSDKDFLETLEESMSVFHYRRHKLMDDSFPNHFISSIQQAIVKQQVIEIEYYSLHSDEVSKRKVEPIGLSHIHGSWHLFAWCRLRKAVRDFRSDRIKSLHALDERYDKSKLPNLETIAETFYNPSELKRIVIHLHNSIPKSSTDMKYYLGVVEENKKEEHTEMIFLHYSLKEFAKWLVFWGDKVKIVEPKELVQEMKMLSKELHKHYN
jgi:predicted DNA-binding transcriptional regulator YafY